MIVLEFRDEYPRVVFYDHVVIFYEHKMYIQWVSESLSIRDLTRCWDAPTLVVCASGQCRAPLKDTSLTMPKTLRFAQAGCQIDSHLRP